MDITQSVLGHQLWLGIGKLRGFRTVLQKGNALKLYKNVVNIEQVQGLY